MTPIKYAKQIRTTRMQEKDGVLFFTFPGLEQTGVLHGFSTRIGGVSQGDLASMNLDFHRGDDIQAVMENHRRFAKAVGYDENHLVASDQVHSNRIYKVTEKDWGKGITRESDISSIDGLMTNVPETPLMIFSADCVPLFFSDPVHKVVGLAHSGWRGTTAGIGACMIHKMEQEYGSRPGDIRCAIGPSICQNCYEVGGEVAEAFRDAFPQEACRDIIKPGRGEKYQLDLWAANRYILLTAGIKEEHLEITDLCTCCNPALLFSHRASKGKRGNLGAVIMLPE